MFPSLEIIELKLRAEIWGVKLHGVARIDLFWLFIWYAFGPFSLFLVRKYKHDKHKKYLFCFRLLIFLRFIGDLFGNESQNGILVKGFEKRTPRQSQE